MLALLSCTLSNTLVLSPLGAGQGGGKPSFDALLDRSNKLLSTLPNTTIEVRTGGPSSLVVTQEVRRGPLFYARAVRDGKTIGESFGDGKRTVVVMSKEKAYGVLPPTARRTEGARHGRSSSRPVPRTPTTSRTSGSRSSARRR